jgi:hypothetical protein
MAEKMHDLLFLCNEFRLTGLLFQVTDFISGHLIAESEAPRLRGAAAPECRRGTKLRVRPFRTLGISPC